MIDLLATHKELLFKTILFICASVIIGYILLQIRGYLKDIRDILNKNN